MAKAIHELTEQNPLEEDMIPIERETSTDVYSGYRLSAESLMKSHLAGNGCNIASYDYHYFRDELNQTTFNSVANISSFQFVSNVDSPLQNPWCLEITGTGTGTPNMYLNSIGPSASDHSVWPMMCNPDSLYLISWWAKSSQSGDIVYLNPRFHANGGPYVYTKPESTPWPSVTEQWGRYKVLVHNTVSDADRMVIQVVGQTDSTSTFHIAGIMIEEYQGNGDNTDASAYIPPVYIPE